MSPRSEVEVVVIGAGAVGLACAAALARAGRSVLVIERQGGIARELTSRNSEVVHAGIYYPQDSLKARLCTAGRERLYAWCAERGVAHRKLGKLIVASEPDELGLLEDLRARAEANGVPGLEMLSRAAVRALEPALDVVAALHSPETGIVDAHGLSLSLLADAEAHGATLLLHHEVCGLAREGGGWRVDVRLAEGEAQGTGGDPQALGCDAVVNAAGLAAQRVAEAAGIDLAAAGYVLHPCKGDYFTTAPGCGVSLSRLVYPVPAGAGLGIHATLDLAGRLRFGPDAEYVSEIDYAVDAGKAEVFSRAVRRYLPQMRAEWLQPDYAGIRPKLAGPGEGFRDFVVAEESARGLPGLVSCIGIESPGLTAAIAIGDRVASLLGADRGAGPSP